jgi:alpha-tubulin suppressor-like RCC1 family protein
LQNIYASPKGKSMQRLPLRVITIFVCLGIFALISLTVQQTFSQNLATPRVRSSQIDNSAPIHAKNLVAPQVRSVRLGSSIPIQVTAGSSFTCALLGNGNVKCWGVNFEGQLGLGDTTNRGYDINQMGDNLPAVNLGSGLTAVAIQSGQAHTCAILNNGSVKCWGANNKGQLGQGDPSARGDGPNEMGDNLLAVDLGNGHTAKKISLNYNSTCAILDDNTTKCWGDNSSGQLGLGDQLNRGDATGEMGTDLPTVDLGTNLYAVTISGGAQHNCALLNNAKVKCWGYNYDGQLGYGNQASRGIATNQMGDFLATVAVGSNLTVTGIFAGSLSTCVILNNATSKCWGNNNIGQLGYGDTTTRGDGPGEMGNDLATLNFGSNTASAFISSSFANPY